MRPRSNRDAGLRRVMVTIVALVYRDMYEVGPSPHA